MYREYPVILTILSNVLAKESHAGVRDNVVGAIARLIIANYSILPLQHIFPIFVAQLPLKDDFVENKAVFESILTLYQAGHVVLQPHIHTLLKVAVSVLHEGWTGSDGEFRNNIATKIFTTVHLIMLHYIRFICTVCDLIDLR